jgi:hypothetical protein
MKLIEQYTALLLSTNDCSPASVSMKLDPSNYPSGIAMLIEKSEANNSIDQSRKEFIQGEREQFEIIKKWHNYLLERNQLDEEWAMLGPIPDDMTFSVKFTDTKEVITEKEKLETLKIRKELGLNTEIDLIKMDNPDMSDEDAQAKLADIKGQVNKAVSEASNVIQQNTDSQEMRDMQQGAAGQSDNTMP